MKVTTKKKCGTKKSNNTDTIHLHRKESEILQETQQTIKHRSLRTEQASIRENTTCVIPPSKAATVLDQEQSSYLGCAFTKPFTHSSALRRLSEVRYLSCTTAMPSCTRSFFWASRPT